MTPLLGDALDEAVRDAVLIEVPGQATRFRFSHALMQRYLYRELGAARRAALHGQIGLALQRRGPGGPVPGRSGGQASDRCRRPRTARCARVRSACRRRGAGEARP